MTDYDIIIIGAGAAGLMAARELSLTGKKIAIIEARDRIGGRIYTLPAGKFTIPAEAGAEFVHGDLELSQSLLNEAGIQYHPMEGRTYQIKKGEIFRNDEFIEDINLLILEMNKLKQDMPFSEFLKQYFTDEQYRKLVESAIKFAEGYDAGDTTKLSTIALREEWKNSDDIDDYLIKGGYSQLMNYLAKQVVLSGGSIHLSQPVKEIRWQRDRVEIVCQQGQRYMASKAIITMPLGVLRSAPESPGYIRFSPELHEKRAAIQTLGFGSVIKILLEFKTAFWESPPAEAPGLRAMPDLGFLFSEEFVPTWWSQLPDKAPLLTGWLAGPQAENLKDLSNESLLDEALNSLASLFTTSTEFLRNHLVAVHIANWPADPFALGAYSYPTIGSVNAREILREPIENTLFFAGEAVWEEGPAQGTVEGALLSGREVVRKMINLETYAS